MPATPYDQLLTLLTNIQPRVILIEQYCKIIQKIIDDYHQTPFMPNVDLRRKFSASEFKELVIWSLESQNADVVKALQVEEIASRFADIMKEIVMDYIKGAQHSKLFELFKNSEWLQNNIQTIQFSVSPRFPIPGTTPLHFLALCGQIEILENILTLKPELRHVQDFYLNTVAHAAAISKNEKIYPRLMPLVSDLEDKENLFGHKPRDYANGKFYKLTTVDQSNLIKSFIKYIELEKWEFDIKDIESGVCFGISEIEPIYFLRGREAFNDYFLLKNIVAEWDGKLESLQDQIANPRLNQLNFKCRKDAFEYLINLYLSYYLTQTDKSLLVVSKNDRPTLMANLNMGKDGLLNINSYAESKISKETAEKLILEQLENNTIVSLASMLDTWIAFTTGALFTGHATSASMNEQNEIFICDPNFPFAATTVSKEKIGLLMNIIYENMTVMSIHTYKYFPDKNTNPSAVPHIQSLKPEQLNRFLVGSVGKTMGDSMVAIKNDAVFMLKNCIKALSNPLMEHQVIDLMNAALGARSFGSFEYLLNEYQSYGISLGDFTEEDQARYLAYQANRKLASLIKPSFN